MRRLVGVLALLTLIAATMSPALAKGKAVKTTLYMHGVYQIGELDGADWIANSTPPMQMTAAEPDGQAPRSMFTGNPALNKQCTGLPTGFPTWEAIGVAGKIVGDAKLTMNFVSPPTNVTARLWVDTPMFSCNEAYVEPTVEVLVPVPAGQNAVEIVFPKLNIAAKYNVIVEILGSGSGQAGRVLYDSPDAATALEFTCIPASGKACI